jgi:hypothetical protein
MLWSGLGIAGLTCVYGKPLTPRVGRKKAGAGPAMRRGILAAMGILEQVRQELFPPKD